MGASTIIGVILILGILAAVGYGIYYAVDKAGAGISKILPIGDLTDPGKVFGASASAPECKRCGWRRKF